MRDRDSRVPPPALAEQWANARNEHSPPGTGKAKRRAPPGMRILCINPVFVPVADSEALCSGKVVNALIERGIDTTVLSFELKANAGIDGSRMWEPLEKVTVRVGSPPAREPLRSALLGVRYRTTTYSRWLQNALETATRISATRPFDLIYSRSLPMVAHVAANWISRRLALPWVANINDPWDWHLFPGVSPSNPSLLANRVSSVDARVSDYWLRRTLKAADVITYPAERLWRFHERISGIRHAARVIPHIGLHVPQRPAPGKIVIVHAGKIGTNEVTMRSAAGFFRAMAKQMTRDPALRSLIELVFVGPRDNDTNRLAEEMGLGNNLVATGRVSYEQSLNHIGAADLCLLIEGDIQEGIYLPSKFADYIASGKPVIALSPAEGTIADLGTERGVFRANPDDDEAIDALLGQLFQAIRQGHASAIAPSAQLQGRYNQGPVVDDLVACFGYAIERHRRADVR